MKRFSLLSAVVMSVMLFYSCSNHENLLPVDNQENVTLKSASVNGNGKYIVVLKEDAGIANANVDSRNSKVKAKAYGLLKKNGITEEVEEVYGTVLQGFALKMAPGQAKKLALDENVKYIEPDQLVALSPIEMEGVKPSGGTSQPAQTTPWGIIRVGGGLNTTTNTAWIIDTGIDYTHPDLNVDTNRSKTFVPRTSTANDDNGHGSHVSGTIAARNNTIGVVGVAPGATLVAVKVLDKRGSGAYSTVIAGVDYVGANGVAGDVANMSLGGPKSQALDDAVLAASAKVKFSLAAGNESDDANNHSPARVNGVNIFTVSAMSEGDIWAYFSNYGNPPVDFCAPGVSIKSTWKGGGYNTISGTSMAAPHVAGLLLLGSVKTNGFVTGDPDGKPDPIAHN
jgi:subtilisin family serine protease